MLELYGSFEDGEIIYLKFSRDFLNNVDDADIFEIFEAEYEKRFGRYSVCRYLSASAE